MRWILIIGLLISSCVASHNLESVSFNQPYLTYKQVKVKLSTKAFGDVTLKGFISMTHDSSFCFKFYGPLSMEVVSGLFDDEFRIMDHVNNIAHKNALEELQKKTGIVLNRRIFEFLLVGKLGEVKNELETLNGSLLKFQLNDDKSVNELVIQNIARACKLSIECKYSGIIPQKIWIAYNDPSDKWSLRLEVISANNDRKRCNFDF